MSHLESSCLTAPGTESPCVCVGESTEDGKDDSADRNTKCVSNECSSPDSRVRERVLKEVGLTSTTFIGPAFPPATATVKSDMEDTLSEFYKELGEIDTPDGVYANPGKQDEGRAQPPTPPKASTCKPSEEKIVNARISAEADGYQKISGHKQPSRPHWYQNEPYYPRRPRPGPDLSSGRDIPAQNQRHYPPPLNRPPNPRLHTPPFHHPPPPPTSAFLNPQNLPPRMNPNWSGSDMENRYPEDSHYPAFSGFPPTHEYSPPTQGYHGDYHCDRDERRCTYDAYSANVNVGWSRDKGEGWSQFDEDYDRRQRFVSENELWEQQHHCRPPDNTRAYDSSLVLILMRGLPGSGKSTLARELLSTGPSGLILSTDDYFAYKDAYRYEPGLLGVAHEWNQNRAKDAMHDGRSPIIIDNTNIQAWEMKPYVRMALERGYKVDFCEPDTSWKLDPYELEKRNKHGVPQEKIAQMLDRFSFPISIDIVMSSQEPPHVNQRRRAEQPLPTRRSRDFH